MSMSAMGTSAMSPSSEYDVVVVGGGPAGMTAARDLARLGLRTVLVEESEQLGGQYYKPRSAAVVRAHGEHRRYGKELAAQVRDSGVQVRTSALVWGMDDDGDTLLTSGPAGAQKVAARGRDAGHRAPVPGVPGVVVGGGSFSSRWPRCGAGRWLRSRWGSRRPRT